MGDRRGEGDVSGDLAAAWEAVRANLRACAGARLFEQARLLGAALRVAFPISVAMEGVLPRTPLVVENGALVLHLPEDLRALASDRLSSRLRGLARLLGVEARIAVA